MSEQVSEGNEFRAAIHHATAVPEVNVDGTNGGSIRWPRRVVNRIGEGVADGGRWERLQLQTEGENYWVVLYFAHKYTLFASMGKQIIGKEIYGNKDSMMTRKRKFFI